MKKILVVSYMALMNNTPNGRTMKSLIQGVERENICTFNVIGSPDSDCCSAGYKMNNTDVLKSIFSFHEFGHEVELEEQSQYDNNVIPSEEVRKKKKNSWKYLFRELVWSVGHTKGKRFKKWLKNQKPDCIVYMYGDSPSLQNLSLWISKYLNIPLIVYSCENYCFKNYNYIDSEHQFPFSIYNKLSLKATNQLFKRCDTIICNSDELCQEFQENYPSIKNTFTITMASNLEYIKNTDVRKIEDTKIIYMGALGWYRVRALVNIANALSSIDPRLKLDVYGRTNDSKIIDIFNSCDNLRYNGYVSYDEVQRITREAALNLEVINIDPIIERNKKYGLSTKFADAVSCGTPFLLYAPMNMIETSIALKNQCAFIVNDNKDLVEVLKRALFDQTARELQVDNALETKKKLFNNSSNIEKFDLAIDIATINNTKK